MVFKNEYEYLIHLINCTIHHTVPEDVPDHISFEKVWEYGITHEVANIAYPAVEKLPAPPDASVFNRFKQAYYQSLKRDTLQSKERTAILAAMHSRGIYTLEVQGTVVKRYYPQSHLRMMSDMDFIIPEDKLQEAETVMQTLGYETMITHNGTEILAIKDQMHIEVHTVFFDPEISVHAALSDRPYTLTKLHDDYHAAVSDTVFYLFHLLHSVKHAQELGGIGIRRIIDLYYLEIALKDTADMSYIDRTLKAYGFYDTKTKLIAVKDHWFCGAGVNEDILTFEQDIFEAGNQGTHEIYRKNRLRQERAKGKRFVKIKYFLGFLFPKKENIYLSYPFCEKHRLPTVLCWIYRWIVSGFNIKKWGNVKRIFSIVNMKIK